MNKLQADRADSCIDSMLVYSKSEVDDYIAELEKERDALLGWQKGVYSLAAYLVFHESNSDATMVKAKKLLEQRDLEQQAKAIKAALNDFMCDAFSTQVYVTDLDRRVDELTRRAAKKLKEQE